MGVGGMRREDGRHGGMAMEEAEGAREGEQWTKRRGSGGGERGRGVRNKIK